jgi:hypothetical protein
MSFSFPHVSREYIRQRYNALGLLWGVPVYVYIEYNAQEEQAYIDNVLEECNWVPTPLFRFALWISQMLTDLAVGQGRDSTLPLIILKTWEVEGNV